MSTSAVEPSRPGWRFWFRWMLATIVGAAGIVLSFPFQLILEAALGPNLPPPWTATETALIAVLKGAEGGVMGLGMGLGQWWVFRIYLKQSSGWIIATGLALFLQGAFRWSLPYDTPPGQVGVSITLSFGVFLGLCQWFVLRGRVPYAGWWIAINVAGWLPALGLMLASEFGGLDIDPILGMFFTAITSVVPFAVAGGGMVWLLRQTVLARQAVAS